MKIVAVTACTTGIAHTYLCAEALQDAAAELGHEIRIETMGSVGAEDVLTDREIAEAELVMLAVEITIPKDRFKGKPVYETHTHEVTTDPVKIMKDAISWLEHDYDPSSEENSASVENPLGDEPDETLNGTGGKGIGSQLYKHLMCGVSYIIPFIVAGGIINALSTAFSNLSPGAAEVLGQIGGHSFSMMIPILAAYMAYSAADRPGLVPGMVAGFMAIDTGSGFVGGIIGGYLAGYLTLWMKNHINLGKNLKSLMPILVLPLLSTLIVGVLMKYVVGIPIAWLNDVLTNFLNGMNTGGASAILLGALVACMVTVDFGGVLCRVSYAFAVATLATGEPSMIMAANMAGGIVTGLSLTAGTLLFPKKFTTQEAEMGKSTWLLGLSFIVECGIPYVLRDPKAHIIAQGGGAAVTGALIAIFNCTQTVPHGGLWVAPIPGALGHVLLYILAVLCGVAFATLMMFLLKKNVREKA